MTEQKMLIISNIFNEIDKLLDKHVIMVPFQEGAYKLYFNRTLEVDLAELKNNLLRGGYEDS